MDNMTALVSCFARAYHCRNSNLPVFADPASEHLDVNVSRKMTFTALVDSMTVHTKERITFPLTCGMEVEA